MGSESLTDLILYLLRTGLIKCGVTPLIVLLGINFMIQHCFFRLNGHSVSIPAGQRVEARL